MRIIHTADWHLGRKLKGQDRTPEIAQQLDALLQIACDRGVDAVVIAGDIFDHANPSTEAERAAYQFFAKLEQARIPAVAIAGNHDSAQRIDGISHLLSLANVHARGKPRSLGKGGVVRLETASGELRVAAMPFVSERRFLADRELWEKTGGEQMQTYRDRMSKMLGNLASGFSDRSVNLLTAHFATAGAQLSHSEREFESVGAYCLSEQLIPDAQYVALGHIHKPQQLSTAIAPTYYSGSPIQIDFGEAKEEKGFNLIDLEPGGIAQVEFVPLPCPKPLLEINCSVDELDARLEAHRDHAGWLKVIVHLDEPRSQLASKVKEICPQALHVETRYRRSATDRQHRIEPAQLQSASGALEQFRAYYRDRRGGGAPSAEAIAAFEELYREAQEEHRATD